jgi:YidC/Oxa1 family membrane protein insertase
VGASGVGKLTFTGKTSKGLVLERIFTFDPNTFVIGQQVVLTNESAGIYQGRLGQSLISGPFSRKSGRYDTVAGCLGGRLFTEAINDAPGELAGMGQLVSADWLGYMDQYFLTAQLLNSDTQGNSGTQGLQTSEELLLQGFQKPNALFQAVASWPLRLNPGSKAAYDFSLYLGPKDSQALDSAGHNLIKSIDLGWFGFLAKPLAWLLRLFYDVCGNYGVAILIVTLLIKIALWPLTVKSYKSMKAMQKLQPRIMAIREKHKDDREALNREMLQVYKTYKVSPLGGCLPMLLQIPFFIAFYRVLDYALELRGAPFVLWIRDLSAPDRLFNFGFQIPFLEPPTGIPVMTILMAASMFWQQKMTPTMGDPMQAKMMMFMPIIFSIILLNMPSGLVLYWLFNNVLSILQQKYINRSSDPVSLPKVVKKGK